MAPSAEAAGNGGGAGPGAARDELLVYVNGVRRTLPPGRAEVTLLQYLRGAWHARAPGHAMRARRRSPGYPHPLALAAFLSASMRMTASSNCFR